MARESAHSQWEFREEDEIAPGLTALKLLGGGLRYEAYLAWHERLRALVVAKVVRPDLVEDRGTLAGLQREIELLERLNHPIIVRSFGGRVDGPRPHVVLEHLEGPRLSSLKRRHGPLLVEQLVALAIEVSAALHYLAEEDLVHLDVKPSNIIMGGPPRLIDLSVARTVEQCAALRSPVGTDAYMAPEQATVESEQLGPPADVWGLGATLHEAVTGERPFRKGVRDSADPAERFPQLTEEPPELPAQVPPALAESIMACLDRDPAARPTPGELGDRLQLVLQDLPKPRLASLKPRRRW
ncbi:MAG: serine/threonine-protein kinase [Thermoleophilaceae bacterium]